MIRKIEFVNMKQLKIRKLKNVNLLCKRIHNSNSNRNTKII